MDDGDSRKWTFQLNIVGLTLLLFSAGYIGKHAAVLVPLSGFPKVLLHYLGELVLTAMAVVTALWRAYGTSERHRSRVAWLERSATCYYLGLGLVVLNFLLLTLIVVLGVQE
jgi:hypothetical protein